MSKSPERISRRASPAFKREETQPAQQVKEIAELKFNDLNAVNIEGAIKIIAGTARSMGIEIAG